MQEIDGRVILLILFVVISAVKWLAEKIKSSDQEAEENKGPDNLKALYEEFRDEIRQRQTRLEKKQHTQPPAAAPEQTQSFHAPPAAPAPLPQPVHRVSTAADRITQPAKPYKPAKTIVTAEQRAAASRFAQRTASKRKPSAQTYVRALLSNPQSARQAIILAEILGKPKSMQRG